MDISVINVQLDLGGERRGTDMGPSAMHVAGLVPRLSKLGHKVTSIHTVATPSFEATRTGNPSARFLTPIVTIAAEIAARVENALKHREFPLVLGGDHAQAIGTIVGLTNYLKERGERLGVLWVDAHTDMNTPDTTPSGNIHGMPLAVLLGHGPQELVSLSGSEPALRPEDVAIIGARDVDAAEAPLVKSTGVRVYTMSELDERGTSLCVREALDRITEHTAGMHLSFDLDGVDPSVAPGVGTPVPGGLTLRESLHLCEATFRTKQLMGMEVVELNPTLDVRNQTGQFGVWLIASALGKSIL